MLKDILLTVLRIGVVLLIVFLFFDGYEKYKNIAFYTSLTAWLLLSLATLSSGFRWKNIAFISLILLMFSALASSSMSGNIPVDKILHPFYTMYLMPILLYSIVSAAFNGKDKIKLLCTILAVIGVARMLYTVFVSSAIPLSAPIDNEIAKNLSLTAIFLIPFMFAQYAEGKGVIGVLWFIVAVLSFAGLLFIGVRASWVAVLFVGFIWTVSLEEKQYFSVKLIILSAIIVLILFRFYPAQFSHVREHISEKTTVSNRLAVWKTTVDISSKDRIVTGHGIDAAMMRDSFTKTAAASGVLTPLPKQWPDNVFLSILYMQGAVGLFFFVIALLYAGVRLLTIKSGVIGTPNFTAIAILSAIVAETVMRVFFFEGNIINLSILLAMAGSLSNKLSLSA